ncbi:MAG TPA: indolepyruvate ferredoxin oxidoreductase subunit alpha [Clostridia bacterium]|nr:indolepyruvate ferredoxin oxidoreductase subunit alpha [Clostridia bacterium]
MSKRELLTGNEAIARGAYEAGVTVCSAYPGTPSTEIFENLAQYKDSLYAEWAPNEKVATEVAYGASIANARSLTAMKHVGLNVAADLVFTAAYNGVGAGFVIVTADDPDMHSSQNEQDNRRYAQFAKIPLIEPSDSQECKDFMKEAYEISERFDIPVLFRTTTRVSHSKSLVALGEREEQTPARYVRNIPKFVCTPANARRHRPELEEKLKGLEAYANTSPLNSMELNGGKIGVLSASIAYQYAKEVFPADTSFLKLGFTWPLPMDLIRTFASKVETLYVVEELEPFMEEQLKAAGIACIGKQLIPPMYELNPEIVRRSIFGTEPNVANLELDMVARPPALCPGCPHRGFFYVLSKRKDFVITGDIGCYTLGYAAPLSAMDTCACMGGGFSLGMGMAKAFAQQGVTDKKIFGVVGDSTFFHSGLTGAVEILYNKGNMIPCVLDNSITGMTGHQDNPGTGFTLEGEIANKIAIEDVLTSFGFENVIIVDPQDLKAMQKAVDDALASTVPAAIIVRRPCVLIKRIKHDIGKCEVDRDKCRSCKICLKVACPALHMKDGKTEIDQTLCVGCKVCAQACPFDAISRIGEQKGE